MQVAAVRAQRQIRPHLAHQVQIQAVDLRTRRIDPECARGAIHLDLLIFIAVVVGLEVDLQAPIEPIRFQSQCIGLQRFRLDRRRSPR